MRKTTFLLCAALCSQIALAQTIAFPGAEGWGRFATGGRSVDERGSQVYYVTTLDDCTDDNLVEGTMRWALRTGDDTPRTILFKVCGTIRLTSVLKFAYPNVTIAGQSAPGGGICISGSKIYVCKDNVIIRHMRFRAGDEATASYPSIDVENCKHIIIDHCSFSWSMEENVTMYDNDSTTMQWCILSEPLYYSKNIKGQRSYGSQWGGEHSTFHHNLLAHCFSRSPRINGARDKSATIGAHDQFVDSEVANNVIYNWGNKGAVYGGELESIVEGAYSRTNLMNNYYKPGPTTNKMQDRWFADLSHSSGKATGAGQWYINGNMFEINEYKNDKNAGDHSAVNADNWANALTDSRRAINMRLLANTQAGMDSARLYAPSANSGFTLTSATQAYADVLASAGASLPRLDEVDIRILAEAAGTQAPTFHGTYVPTYIGIIDSQNDLMPAGADSATWSAWPTLAMRPGEQVATDTDADGIPDAWENAHELDANNAADGAQITASGYSNLELYLNSIQPTHTGISQHQQTASALLQADRQAATLHFTADNSVRAIAIYAANGLLCQQQNVQACAATIHIAAPSGLLLVHLTYENGSYEVQKIVW